MAHLLVVASRDDLRTRPSLKRRNGKLIGRDIDERPNRLHPERVHDHAHPSRSEDRHRLAAVFALTLVLMAFEGAAGFLTHSLALLADAAHMLADVAALGLSLAAMNFAERPATPQKTYGFYRVEILAAFANAILLFALSGLIFYEAWQRLHPPTAIHSVPMLVVAAIGLGVNAWSAILLRRGSGHNLNMKAAYLEVFSDALASLGVVLAAVIILATGWLGADAIVSAAIGLFILPRTWRLLRDAVDVLLEGTPRDVELPLLRQALLRLPGVVDVHDLHVWSLTSDVHAMSAHVIRSQAAGHDDVLALVREAVLEGFAIHHVTLQVESAECGDSTHD